MEIGDETIDHPEAKRRMDEHARAASTRNDPPIICRRHAFRWDRRRNKIISSQAALLMLKRRLEGEREDG